MEDITIIFLTYVFQTLVSENYILYLCPKLISLKSDKIMKLYKGSEFILRYTKVDKA